MVRRVMGWGFALGAMVASLTASTAVAQSPPAEQERAAGPAVHGVLFYSPTCPHCREVMTESLPPILARYGPALEVVSINVATPAGQQLYRATIESFALPRERVGVPTLLVGDRVLVGSWEIPNLLPGIVDTAVTGDGIDWPPVPLIRRALAAQGLIAPEDVAIAAPVAAPPTGTEADADAPTADTARAADTAPAGDAAGEAAGAEIAGEEAVGEADAGSDASGPPTVRADTGAVAPATASSAAAAGSETPAPEVSRAPVAGSRSGAEPDRPAAETPGRMPTSQEATGAADDSLGAALAEAIDPEGRMALVHELSVRERLALDPAGNGLAIAVLILMLVTLGLVLADVAGGIRIPAPPPWAIPLLSLVGMGVAAYLAFVEVTGAEAVCGPVGNCNVVQQSPYARILGVPVGVLGVLGYAGLLAVWSAGRLVGPWAPMARVTVWWMALGATGFSLYLTFLEPFVIGASCAWCLTSAVATTLVLLAATPERYARDRVGVSPTSRPSVSH